MARAVDDDELRHFGWDGPDSRVGSWMPTLRDRLPVDLRDTSSDPVDDELPFTRTT